MQHQEAKRILPESETAVLFIHGINGSPNHFDFLLPYLPSGCSFFNMLLDGHGKRVQDFAKTSLHKWEAQVNAAVCELSSTHKEIWIVAHSMGTLFAIEQAIQNKNITKLFLLAVPLKLFLKPTMLENSWKSFKGNPKENDPVGQAACNCCSIRHSKNIFAYLGWLPRYLELFFKIRETNKLIPLLTTNTLAYQSAKDEMVSKKSICALNANPHIQSHMLLNSRHFYYNEADTQEICHAFQTWLES